MSYYGQQQPQFNNYFNPVGNYGDMGSMQTNIPTSGPENMPLSTGILAAFGTSGYPGEPSLLQEIGVNFDHILQKTKAVIHPLGLGANDESLMEDSDLAGPILFFLLFGVFLFLSGKSHFGYVYGLGLIGAVLQYSILNLMAVKQIDFIKTMSVLGYCMLPLVLVSGLGVFMKLNSMVGYIIGTVAIGWCTISASSFFIVYLQLSHVRALVAYPLALFYGIYSLLTLFQ